jgi:hypothetical protein
MGTLRLYKQNSVVSEAPAFSGGGGHGEIPEGTYTINLANRGVAQGLGDLTTPDQQGGRALRPIFGVQEIPQAVRDEQGVELDFRYEWGSKRARLTPDPGDSRQAFRGNYIHGKWRTEGGDYTHGCVCDRGEGVLDALFGLPSKQVPRVPVQVKKDR